MNKITTIIFDFGNVIAFFNHMKTCSGLVKYSSLSKEEIYAKIFKSDLEKKFDEGIITPEEFFVLVKKDTQLNNEIDFDEFSRIWANIFWENPKMLKMIQELHSLGYKLCLLSNTNVLHSLNWNKDFPILNLFRDIRLSWQTAEFRKPDLRMWTEAGWNLQESVYVDDKREYCEAAEKAGVSKAFCYDGTKHEDFEKELLGFLGHQ